MVSMLRPYCCNSNSWIDSLFWAVSSVWNVRVFTYWRLYIGALMYKLTFLPVKGLGLTKRRCYFSDERSITKWMRYFLFSQKKHSFSQNGKHILLTKITSLQILSPVVSNPQHFLFCSVLRQLFLLFSWSEDVSTSQPYFKNVMLDVLAYGDAFISYLLFHLLPAL